jgi:hypothetical protein
MDQIGVDGFRLARETETFLAKREKDIAESAKYLCWSADISTRVVDPHGKFARLIIKEIDEAHQ